MNRRNARNGHIMANRLIRLYKVHFTYQLPGKDTIDEAYVHHHGWGKQSGCNEPLVPVSSQSVNALVNAQGGTATQYQFIWISHHDVPMKTKVNYKHQQFTVIDKADYQEFAGVFVYYLKGRSDLND